MRSCASESARRIIGCTTLLVAPFVVTTAYLWLSRTYDLWNWHTGTADFLALGASIAAGLVGVIVLPMGRVSRAVFAVVYIPVSACVLILWSLSYVCGVFGACL